MYYHPSENQQERNPYEKVGLASTHLDRFGLKGNSARSPAASRHFESRAQQSHYRVGSVLWRPGRYRLGPPPEGVAQHTVAGYGILVRKSVRPYASRRGLPGVHPERRAQQGTSARHQFDRRQIWPYGGWSPPQSLTRNAMQLTESQPDNI